MSKQSWMTVMLVVIFLIGLSLLLYPSFSNYWNSLHQSQAVATYLEELQVADTQDLEVYWQEAEEYNKAMNARTNSFSLTDLLSMRYNSVLNLTGTGIMGYVVVPAINETLPIYHGTSDNVLQHAVGHLEWTNLPIGGEGTHSALSGHRGLPSAKLFSDLDKVVVGDVFMLQILDQTLTYEIDQVLIVLPEDSEALLVEPGKDYCTLVTCTPYGVNTHRMLVRGHRIENIEQAKTIRIVSEAMKIEPLIVAIVLGLPLILLLFILIVTTDFAHGIFGGLQKIRHPKE